MFCIFSTYAYNFIKNCQGSVIYISRYTVPFKLIGTLNEKQHISLNTQFIMKSTDLVYFNS